MFYRIETTCHQRDHVKRISFYNRCDEIKCKGLGLRFRAWNLSRTNISEQIPADHLVPEYIRAVLSSEDMLCQRTFNELY